MKKHFTLKKTGLSLLGLLLVAQFFRIDKSTKPVDNATDFMAVNHVDSEIAVVLKTACYDCHSNQPSYPWYTNIAPVSWWIKHHINEGSHHLNFSDWGIYKSRRKDHKLEECVEMLEEGEMPMSSYTLLHADARLSETQKQMLIVFFNSLRTHESDKPEQPETAH